VHSDRLQLDRFGDLLDAQPGQVHQHSAVARPRAVGFPAHLSRYGDVIAEKTGLGGAWIGLILLASVTSLPELVTGFSAIVIADVPNIAIGDALGSCVFNLAIISLADVLHREQSVPVHFVSLRTLESWLIVARSCSARRVLAEKRRLQSESTRVY
jgi:hypothetical protein